MMAEAHAKATGCPGVCFVTRGPGCANALAGLHVASQDSTPLMVFVGQVPRSFKQREAWQEVDVHALFDSVAKWAIDIQETERLPEHLSRAFATAQSGRMGPVVMGLPEDLLYQTLSPVELAGSTAVQGYPSPRDMHLLESLLSAARHPLIVVGVSGWTVESRQQLESFVEKRVLTVVTAFRRQDRFDNSHAHYDGDAGLVAATALT